MGVTGLWYILSEICERKPLTYLSGKKVAIDLSGWVVQATQCHGLNTAKNPHLRNLFFRVAHLLQLGVFPIFVIEGKPPAIKEAAIKARYGDRYPENSNSGISRSYFDKILKQCEDFLKSLGVPCVKSCGEGEAFCAFLCLKGVVSGVITEDNDAFLYGADVVFRDLSIEPSDPHVNAYCLKSPKNKHNLDQKKLVALALLLGCDYCKGLPGIGKETALKLLSEIKFDDILQRFKDWKNLSESELFPGLENKPLKKGAHCNRCGHLGSASKHKKGGCSACNSEITCYLPDTDNPCRCAWHTNNELSNNWKTELKIYNTAKNCPLFPDLKVVDEYLNFTDTVPSDDVLDWTCPKLLDFQEKAFSFLNWTFESSFEKVLPLITSWQQYKLGTSDCDKTLFIYEPVKILKERSIKDDSYFDVKWKSINNCDSAVSDDNLVTTEYGDRFAVLYKDLVDNYYKELREQKQAKANSKKLKTAEGSRKIHEFFTKKAHSKIFDDLKSKNMDTKETNISSSSHTDVAHSEIDGPSPKKMCI